MCENCNILPLVPENENYLTVETLRAMRDTLTGTNALPLQLRALDVQTHSSLPLTPVEERTESGIIIVGLSNVKRPLAEIESGNEIPENRFNNTAPSKRNARTPVTPTTEETDEDEDSEPTCELCSEVEGECECWTCQACDRRRRISNSTCSTCEACESCCDCTYCGNCGNTYRDGTQGFCGDCDRCSNCCRCDNDEDGKGPRVAQRFQIERPLNLKGFRENKLRRPISIELELSSVGYHEELKNWATKARAGLVEDGSIPSIGCEINTNPASGDIFLSRTAAMIQALKSSDSDVDESCGLHVHVDASDYSQYDLRKLILLWTCVESSMYELVSRKRYENAYCKVSSEAYASAMRANVPFADKTNAHTWNERMGQILYSKRKARDAKKDKREKYSGQRYFGLNIHSFFFRKTIEVRLHESTTNAETLKNWPLVCAHIVEFASVKTESQIMELLKSDKTSLEILLLTLPPSVGSWVNTKIAARRAARGVHNETVSEFLSGIDHTRATLANSEIWHETRKAPCKHFSLHRAPAKQEVFAWG